MINPHEIYEKLTGLGNKWAEAKYHADQLDDSTKPLLSQLGHDSGESSEAAKAAAALRSPEYKKHCTEKNQAKMRENKARIEYHAAQTWVDVQRTIAATERQTNRSAT